jgi:transcriptional regulator with XRE-family HTH domain
MSERQITIKIGQRMSTATRGTLHMSQYELAQKLGTTRASVSVLEQGRCPLPQKAMRRLAKLADAAGVTSVLLDGPLYP